MNLKAFEADRKTQIQYDDYESAQDGLKALLAAKQEEKLVAAPRLRITALRSLNTILKKEDFDAKQLK